MLRVVVGGTFEYMHKGHMALLKKAFDIGDFVYIGLTSDSYVKKKGRKIGSYLARLRRLRKEVRMLAEETGHRYRIAKLNDSARGTDWKAKIYVRWEGQAARREGQQTG